MKAILKATLFAALSGVLVGALLKKLLAEATRIPTLEPLRDAEPNVDEPLKEEDLRVAQNAPF